MQKSWLGTTAACAVAALVAAGCGDDTSVSSTTSAKVTGRVVDATALDKSGLDGVDVTLVGDGTPRTTQTNGDGYFAFEGVSLTMSGLNNTTGDSVHTVEVEASNYADASIDFELDSDSPDAAASVSRNLGQVGLSPTVDRTVNVTEGGSLIGHDAPVVAMPTGTPGMNGRCDNSFIGGNNIQRSAATTSSGSVDLTLAECANYNIYVPAHSPSGYSGDLPAKYTTAVYSTNPYDPSNSGNTIAIGLSGNLATVNDPIQVVDASVLDHVSVTYTERNFSDTTGANPTSLTGSGANNVDTVVKGNPIQVVFNYPVTAENVDLRLTQFLENPDSGSTGAVDADFNDNESISASASLDSTGTILTITPDNWSNVPANELLAITGKVVADNTGSPRQLEDLIANPGLYVADGSTIDTANDITADNYVTGATGRVYLEFPDFVRGQVRYIETVRSGTTNVLIDSNSPFRTHDMLWTDANCNNCGTGSGTVARYDTGGFLDDNDDIKVDLTFTDAEGNQYDVQKTLTVK